MEDKPIRINEISDCRQRGIVCKGPNLDSSQFFKHICNTIINHPSLTIQEKKYLINDLIRIRDTQNIIEETGEKRQCEYCNKQVIAITYCESCIRNYLEKLFNKWTTRNDELDKLIRECQLNVVSPSHIIEWIPFENFKNIEFKEDGIFSSVYIATWKNGPFKEWDAEKHELKRGGNDTYILKSLKNSKTADELWPKN
ncbi:34596_t:CDS:1, partial [Racocetra persica]